MGSPGIVLPNVFTHAALHNSPFVITGCLGIIFFHFPLGKGQRACGAATNALAKTVAKTVGNHMGFAVHNSQGTARAFQYAFTTTNAQFFIHRNNGSHLLFHKKFLIHSALAQVNFKGVAISTKKGTPMRGTMEDTTM